MSEISVNQEIESRKLTIQVMPDKELLEDFINGSLSSGPHIVYFDIDKGEFIRLGDAST